MILAVDIGNTNVKIGVFKDNELLYSGRLSASTHKTGDEYFSALNDMFRLNGQNISSIKGAIVSSVNPNLNYTFEHMFTSFFRLKPMIVGSGIKTGLHIRYDNPKEVGADRIVNSVSAYNLYGGPCIVLDCGTATTFNVVSASGEFLGGCIGFGLKAGADALSQKAARLPKVELVRPDKVIGKNTITNMQAGLIYGYVGMVEYLIRRIKAERGETPMRVIATGGLSEIVAAESGCIDKVDRALTLKGLNILYQLNA
ncbi:MAG: type III pantothenate kinase [Clostridiales bacterium]|jgi:type III pantothenate kinase|nr:type III pantothenate kinase [Clostridiales bacterium]